MARRGLGVEGAACSGLVIGGMHPTRDTPGGCGRRCHRWGRARARSRPEQVDDVGSFEDPIALSADVALTEDAGGFETVDGLPSAHLGSADQPAALSTSITGTPVRSSSNSSAAEFARTRGEPACVAQAGGGVSVGEDPGEALVDSFAPGLGQVAGNVGDAQAAPDLIADEPAGTDVLSDSAYGSGEFRNHLNQRGMTATIKPGPTRPPVEGAFTIDDFDLDVDANTVTCPNGVTVTLTSKRTATFGAKCRGCRLRSRCIKSAAGRSISFCQHHDLLVAARRQARTRGFDDVYRRHRPMVERSIAWMVRRGHRKARYRGVIRNRIGWSHRAAAVNLQRLVALGLTCNDNAWTIA